MSKDGVCKVMSECSWNKVQADFKFKSACEIYADEATIEQIFT